MGIATFVQDCSGKELYAKAILKGLDSDYSYELDLEEVRILDFRSADFVYNAYSAKIAVNVAIHIDGPNNVSMRLDGEFNIDDGNQIIAPIKTCLIYDTTIHYENPETCEEVYREIGEDAYLTIEITYD